MEIALEELRRLRWELLVCNLLLLGGLLLLGRDLVPVLLGMALGNSAAAANFVLTGIAAEEAVQLPPDQARRKMASSYFSRMLMLALVLAAGLIISWFDPISVVFPLFFVKISLTVGYIFLGKGGNKN
ncbi:MAG: ATP synthase subunit I [Clostridiales bacterium]|jgi:ATP synthase I chain|nr:ATP synthase subunit I [Clostridiales bacterium]